jgi:signal transduction histidine kinase/CheY-like chemotaxis protein
VASSPDVPLAVATRPLDDERAAAMRDKVRIYFAILAVFFSISAVVSTISHAGDAAYRWPAAATEMLRPPEIAVSVAAWLVLRRPMPLRRLEHRTIALWFAMYAWNAIAMAYCPIEQLDEYITSIVLGSLVGVIGAQLTMRAAIGTSFAFALPFLATVSRMGWARSTVAWLVPSFFVAAALLVVRSRERLVRAEHASRAGLEDALQRLREGEQARTRLFVNLSHDFRTPLSVIAAEAELAAAGAGADRAPLERIRRNAADLADLTEQLLEIARLDAGRARVVTGHADVAAIAREVAAQLRPAASLPRLELELEGALIARAAPRDVRRILGNLVGNALRHARASVTVVARGGDPIAIDVIDDGDGIPPDRRAQIFERFVSFAPEGSVASGIGLSVARELAEACGGSLVLVDGAARTTFRVTLPPGDPASVEPATASFARGADAASTAAHEAPVARDTRPRLLVVEDHAELRALLARLLDATFEVHGVATIAEAIAALDDRVRAVLCDVMLPDGEGYALLAEVRRRREGAALPFLFLSARGEPSERARGLEAGADDYLAKPFDGAELRARLRGAVERADARTEALRLQREEFLGELHDGVTACLTRALALLGRGGSPPRLDDARAALREGLAEARAMLSLLDAGPSPLTDVLATIRRESTDACEPRGLEFSLEGDESTNTLLSPAESHCLRRTVREAITNALRHAGARTLRCVVRRERGALHASVEDDGVGLDAPTSRPGHHGLRLLARRAGRLGGEARVLRAETRGTRVELTLPLSLAR